MGNKPKLSFQAAVWAIFDDPVVQGFAFALWGVPLYFALALPTFTSEDQATISNFIEWFGVPYGLILALVLVNVWTQFDTTNRAFDREADAVLTLYNTFLLTSNNSLRSEIADELRKYVLLVIESNSNDKDQVRVNNKAGITEESVLKDIRNKIGKLLNDGVDHDLALVMIGLLNELVDDRGDRVSYVKQRLPTAVKYLSFVTSITWLVPFYSLQFSSPLVGAFFIVVVTLVVVSILLIIIDLDDPIGGTWGVDLESWDNLLKEIGNRQESIVEE